jgi:hypothetical protein
MTDLSALQYESGRRTQLGVGELSAVAALATAVLAMVAGAIEALTTPAVPSLVGGQIGKLTLQVPHLSIGLADRLSIFARSGANLTVALLLIVAVVTAARRVQALTLVSVILASVVILANLAAGLELLRNAPGVFSGFGQTNRAAGLLQCLAPVALSLGLLGYPRRPSHGQR